MEKSQDQHMEARESSATTEKHQVTALEHVHKEFNPDGVAPVTSAFADWSRAACVKKFWRLYTIGLMVSIGGMYSGYGNSVIGSIIANRGFINQFATVTDSETGEPALDTFHISMWNAISFISQVVIQLLSPLTADRFGRKFNMWLLTFFLTLSIVLEIVAKEWIALLMSRLVSGLAGGLIGTSIMIYMSEIAMPQFRGALLGSFSLSYALGQVFLAVGLKVLEDTDPMKFRNIFYSEFVFFGLWMIPMLFFPETPAWYASKGRHDEAKKALGKLIGNVDGYDIDREYEVIKFEVEQSIALAKTRSSSDWKAMCTWINIKRTIISQLPFTFQNFVGVPLIFNYTTYFFQLAKVEDPFLGNMIIQLVLVIGILVSFYTVDKVGRRFLVLWGGGFMGILCFVVGGLGFMSQTKATGAALVAICTIWAFAYANSMAPIGWTSLVEISTPQLRAKTTAIAAVIQSLSGVLFNYTVPMMLSDQNAGWGQKTGLFFGGITFAYLIPCWFLYPETKGRTYQELDELFERGVPAWKFKDTKTAYQNGIELQQEEERV